MVSDKDGASAVTDACGTLWRVVAGRIGARVTSRPHACGPSGMYRLPCNGILMQTLAHWRIPATLLLLIALDAHAMPASKPSSPDSGPVTVERGGPLSRLAHRGTLRAYSEQIRARSLSCDTLGDYLAKGGDPTVLSGYRLYDDFRKPVLNQFIAGRSPGDPSGNRPYETDARTDRLCALALLLDNGADPEFVAQEKPTWEEAPPLLFASLVGDVPAMQLLIARGANVNRVQRTSIGDVPWGPPLLVVASDAGADLLLRNGADPALTLEGGRNLVQVLVTSAHYAGNAQHVLARLRWFQARGIRFAWRDGGSDDPLRRARALRDEHAKWFPHVEDPQARARVWAEIVEVLESVRA